MKQSLNENIQSLRIAAGMNQVALANKVGVTKQCISNWENDNVLPSVEMLTKLSDVFMVSTDYLLGRESGVTVDISGLTEEQSAHIRLLVGDLIALNKNARP